ncbi:hypothetical protein O7543_14745 [Solwaraspora sp. WMMA2080]|uniref:hypothetical protein n=1 Tax=unclassified Solwaraspora TaxID=2627926 RepID=UPI00248D035C|nr:MULTISPECIES: hypothetical protein [unclassified Solwaraspora]WBB97876.1 hypothetical protein O7553_02605 [Solwaraspora sp. WMMA2059]WBC23564.1 hypothetical protein O7543_14745 [Solwaraspora sp. WMMA2080]
MLASRCFAYLTAATHRRYTLLPFHRQTALFRLTRRPGQAARCWLGRRLRPARPTAAGLPRRWSVLDGRPVMAVVVDDDTISPLNAHRRNLHLVTDALARAGVDHFVIPTASGFSSRVGVPAGERTAALRALGRLDGLAVARAGHRYRRLPARPDWRLRRTPVIRVFQPVTGVNGQLTYGGQAACEIEFWTVDGDRLHAPRSNDVTAVVPARSAPVRLTEAEACCFAPEDRIARHVTRTPFTRRPATWPDFPVDLVCCWTDPTDPRWRSRRQRAMARTAGPVPAARRADRHRHRDGAGGAGPAGHAGDEWIGWDGTEELRHLLRSVHLHAPWIRRIFLITADQVPGWLDVNDPQLTVVDHRDLLGGYAVLPTFNPYAVESAVHEIDGLAERFLYLPGNVFLGRPVDRTTFFEPNGIPKVLLGPPPGPGRAGRRAGSGDTPAVAAARRVFADQFDRLVDPGAQVGVPLPVRRSTLAEICTSIPEVVARIRGHQIRHPDDVSLIRSLHPHWSYLRGTAVPGSLRRHRVDPATPDAALRLHRLLDRRDADAFGLDTELTNAVDSVARRLRVEFLSRYFPTRSPYEVDAETAAARAPFTATELAQRLLRPPVGRFPVGPQLRLAAAPQQQTRHRDTGYPAQPDPLSAADPVPATEVLVGHRCG